jgi:hypothetical protein
MKNSFVMIDEDSITQIKQTLEEIKTKMNTKPENDYVTEKEARAIFQRQSTWFWQMRKEGKLPFSKVGKTIYYSKIDIKTLFDQGKIK